MYNEYTTVHARNKAVQLQRLTVDLLLRIRFEHSYELSLCTYSYSYSYSYEHEEHEVEFEYECTDWEARQGKARLTCALWCARQASRSSSSEPD